MTSSTPAAENSLFIKAMPGLFVLLWSTGFIGTKSGLPFAEPNTFLFLRFAILVVLLVPFTLAIRAPWPATKMAALHIAVAGILVHGGYLGGVFGAIGQGLPAGLVALIVGLQPLLTAFGAFLFLHESINRWQWTGLVLGLAGVGLVLSDRMDVTLWNWTGFALSIVALFGITTGTLYQKRFCGHMDMRSGLAIQYAAAAIPIGFLALLFETREVHWTWEFVGVMAWLVVVLSMGTVALLWIMVRRGAVSRVASLFYLVPPFTALMAWGLFGEEMGPLALIGLAVAATGVALATKENR
ncbi:DMT family transporter [Magnetospira sp. QH-2]|uniref:DMT family transporter n=1 Tax=Magnetospira sp. (strain QH-2) TaxID=1288970 RepID=UPI0003E80BE3|nr:DMT family transporter [Magnetospira sp. QH-2]CCQ74822.1 conserved membrane protein of unknown function [Magnetospira sp. QH-2]